MIFTVGASCVMPLNTDGVLLGSSLLWCSPLWAENQSKARGKEKSKLDGPSVCLVLQPALTHGKATWVRGQLRKFCDYRFEINISELLQARSFLISWVVRGPYLQQWALPVPAGSEHCPGLLFLWKPCFVFFLLWRLVVVKKCGNGANCQ